MSKQIIFKILKNYRLLQKDHILLDRFIASIFTLQQLFSIAAEKTGESEVSKQHLRHIVVHRSPCGLGDKRPFSIVGRAYFIRKRRGNTVDARRNLNQEFIDSGVLSARTSKLLQNPLSVPFPDSLFLEETQHSYFRG